MRETQKLSVLLTCGHRRIVRAKRPPKRVLCKKCGLWADRVPGSERKPYPVTKRTVEERKIEERVEVRDGREYRVVVLPKTKRAR
jgi:hypothetical protein